jgi:Ca2+-binding RTX toxin-like protein
MFGGDGNDKLTDKSAARNGFLSGNGGADTIVGGNGGDNLNGGDGNDRIVGGSSDDSLFGNAGNDTLIGLFGNDFVNGDDGNDTLVATIEQDGADDFSGGEGNDTADYSGRNNLAPGTVLSLSLDGVRNDGEPGEGDLLDVENVKGGTGHNVITGNSAANTLQGGQSLDAIFGADGISGNDVIIGGGLGGDSCTFDPGDSVTGCR